MSELFDRDVFFSSVRNSLFNGTLTQQQVDGMGAILADWEGGYTNYDMRYLAYALATAKHETASTMWPIEEYGLGAGMDYGKPDHETGQTYYGRGYVQLTWRENYANATAKLKLTGEQDLEWHASQALDPFIAGHIMFRGMIEGWFRADDEGNRQTLGRYFGGSVDDAYGAREIINGDKTKIPDWSQGISIGNLIADYHDKFLAALRDSWTDEALPEPVGEVLVDITMNLPPGIRVIVTVNGVSPDVDGTLVTTG